MNHENVGAQVHSYAAGRKSRMQRQQWKKEWKKVETMQAWQLDEVTSKKEAILEAQSDKKKVHFAALMDLCLLKNAELIKPKFRVVLLGDIVKDDSGACAVFIEQDSSASQTTAAKVKDVIARLPDCDGQEADAASACTTVKMNDASRLPS